MSVILRARQFKGSRCRLQYTRLAKNARMGHPMSCFAPGRSKGRTRPLSSLDELIVVLHSVHSAKRDMVGQQPTHFLSFYVVAGILGLNDLLKYFRQSWLQAVCDPEEEGICVFIFLNYAVRFILAFSGL